MDAGVDVELQEARRRRGEDLMSAPSSQPASGAIWREFQGSFANWRADRRCTAIETASDRTDITDRQIARSGYQLEAGLQQEGGVANQGRG